MDAITGLYLDDDLRLLNPARRDLEPERGAQGFARMAVRGIDRDRRRVTAVLSSPAIDRYGEIILPSAFEESLPEFMRNPVLLAGHKHVANDGSPTVIGHWVDIRVENNALIGTCQFLEDDELAQKWWQRFVQGAVRAFSVGIIVHAWEMREMPVGDNEEPQRVRVITSAELVEVSAVSVPANPEALVRQRSLGALLGVSSDPEAPAVPGRRSAPKGGPGDLGDLNDGGDDEDDDLDGMSNRRLNKVLARSLRPMLRDELRRMLSAEPGTHLHLMIHETVEMTVCQLQNATQTGTRNNRRARRAPSAPSHDGPGDPHVSDLDGAEDVEALLGGE